MARSRWAILVIAGALALAGTGALAAKFAIGDDGPEQPIAFSHQLHAGKNQIPCMYCHFSADRSVDAGIPSVQTCAGCHLPGGVPMVRADSPGVKQLTAYWTRREPIPWVRIHKVPDHVRFPHMRHVKAGLECQKCHGPVQEMAVVKQEETLRMGWCINCHRARKARTDCFVCHY
jgi:hypothetical protein